MRNRPSQPPILLVGIGAVGGFLYAQLRNAGHHVSVFATDRTAARLRSSGLELRMNGASQRFPVEDITADPRELAAANVVIFAVKSSAFEHALRSVQHVLATNTIVLTTMNGVPWWFLTPANASRHIQLNSLDPTGFITRTLSIERLVAGVADFACSQPTTGVVQHRFGRSLTLGSPVGNSAALARVTETFHGTLIDCVSAPDIRSVIWSKLVNNASMNPISALTGATLAQLATLSNARALVEQAMIEVEAVGKAMGIRPATSIEERIESRKAFGSFKTSMLQDLERCRQPETDALLAAVIEIGQRFDVSTPTLHLLQELVVLRFAVAMSTNEANLAH